MLIVPRSLAVLLVEAQAKRLRRGIGILFICCSQLRGRGRTIEGTESVEGKGGGNDGSGLSAEDARAEGHGDGAGTLGEGDLTSGEATFRTDE